MSGRTIAVIGLALFCGLAAALGIFLLPKQQPAAVETRPVVFAAADIQRGEVIKEPMLELRQVPVDQATPGGLDKLADAIDRAAHMPMLKGDVVSEARLSPKGSGGGMAALIPTGMRAFTIQTTSLSSSLAGFLLPGNRVDVLFTVSTPSDSDDRMGGSATTTLLQNIEILAVHTTVDAPASNKIDPNEARSVTLLVTPDQATILDRGQNKGNLHLALRNSQDLDVVVQKRSVAYATEDIPSGDSITSAMIEVRETPLEKASPGSLSRASDVIDRSPHVLIRKGEAISESQLFPKGSSPGLAAKIKPGMRAFTISTPTPAARLAGFLRRGNRVDVIWTQADRTRADDPSVVATAPSLVQNVEILAVDKTVDPSPTYKVDAGEERSVTLMVSPEEAAILDRGQSTGTLHLTLRNPKDADVAITRPIAPLPTIRPPLMIRTLRGTSVGLNLIISRTSTEVPRPPQPMDPAAVGVDGIDSTDSQP